MSYLLITHTYLLNTHKHPLNMYTHNARIFSTCTHLIHTSSQHVCLYFIPTASPHTHTHTRLLNTYTRPFNTHSSTLPPTTLPPHCIDVDLIVLIHDTPIVIIVVIAIVIIVVIIIVIVIIIVMIIMSLMSIVSHQKSLPTKGMIMQWICGPMGCYYTRCVWGGDYSDR